jgi:hypothetical protein
MKKYLVARISKQFNPSHTEAALVATFDDQGDAHFLVMSRNRQEGAQYWYFILEVPK